MSLASDRLAVNSTAVNDSIYAIFSGKSGANRRIRNYQILIDATPVKFRIIGGTASLQTIYFRVPCPRMSREELTCKKGFKPYFDKETNRQCFRLIAKDAVTGGEMQIFYFFDESAYLEVRIASVYDYLHGRKHKVITSENDYIRAFDRFNETANGALQLGSMAWFDSCSAVISRHDQNIVMEFDRKREKRLFIEECLKNMPLLGMNKPKQYEDTETYYWNDYSRWHTFTAYDLKDRLEYLRGKNQHPVKETRWLTKPENRLKHRDTVEQELRELGFTVNNSRRVQDNLQWHKPEIITELFNRTARHFFREINAIECL